MGAPYGLDLPEGSQECHWNAPKATAAHPGQGGLARAGRAARIRATRRRRCLRDFGAAAPGRRVQAEGLLGFDYPLQVETIGITYGTQSAVVEDILFDAIPLPVTALRAEEDTYTVLLEVTKQAEDLAKAVNNLSADLRRAAGADPIPWDKGQRCGEFVLHALDPLVRRFLAGVRTSADDPDMLERGRTAWEKIARDRTWDIAEKVLATATHSEFGGRAVEKNGREFTYRLATAEQNFRRQINTVLLRCVPAADDLIEDVASAASISAARIS